jgi:putative transposase
MRRFHTIGSEDLKGRGMVRNRPLARAIADMGFFEFRQQLEYKAAMGGRQVVAADRFFASSKTCSDCRHKLEKLPLSVRDWICPECGCIPDPNMDEADIGINSLAPPL